ncbi:hypothetical protein VR41_06910 [Streptomyces sp. NRRL B-1568]|nr:hypothetical protein VR41_06910 [Streptomyces sp. NRRL B-1568]
MPTLHSVLLRRARTVYVDHEPATGSAPSEPRVAAGLAALEAELMDRGHALTGPLRAALGAAGAEALADSGRSLLRAVDAQLGADRTHMPLFQGFPHSVPDDTFALYVDRVFALLLQEPEQPCVLCAEVGSVRPVSPCAHLVCGKCWDGADYTGCPLCHRRIDRTDPFLRPAGDRPAGDGPAAPRAVSGPLRLLVLGTSRTADAAAELAALLARRTPLSPQDREDVRVLVAHAAPGGLGWLPDDVPVRETKALVLGTLLREGGPVTASAVRHRLPAMLTTATDVLRLLYAHSGGEGDLLELPRLRSVPRALRRELLAVLDAFDVSSLVEDLLRHPRAAKRAAEVLHPFEGHARHPRAALAFAALRGTDVSECGAGSLGEALLRTAAEHPHAVVVRKGASAVRIVARTWGARVEEALRTGDLGAATALLRQRPGELVRRLDHLLRRYGSEALPPELAEALERGLPEVGPGPLLSALGELRGRHLPSPRRVFFPRGQVAHAYAVPDERAPLPAPLVARVCALLEAEVLRRLGGASGYELAVLDPALARLAVPFAERTAAASLVSVPRGSELPLPEGWLLRLFLHWVEPEGTRVDLDLSVAFFDDDWNRVGHCDYTTLRHGGDAAVHSGDLTSAPAPLGATEYVDLDLAALMAGGARFAVPVVFSFGNIPFEELPDAFAGFMALPDSGARDSAYHPGAVRQRFDLSGQSRICVPMVIDLADCRALWTDVHLPSDTGLHSVGRHGDGLGRLGRELWDCFTGGSRLTLWDVACWHAAARAGESAVLRPDGLWFYRRREGEDTATFAARLRGLLEPDRREEAEDTAAAAARAAEGRHVFLALVDGDVCPREATGAVYRLFPGAVDACTGTAGVTAGGLLADLA